MPSAMEQKPAQPSALNDLRDMPPVPSLDSLSASDREKLTAWWRLVQEVLSRAFNSIS